ncbi:MAG: DUF84 family protein [Candidatus Acidiferrales bacterium]
MRGPGVCHRRGAEEIPRRALQPRTSDAALEGIENRKEKIENGRARSSGDYFPFSIFYFPTPLRTNAETAGGPLSMKKVIVAVGSKRLPKLNAVWEALNVVGPTLDPEAQFELVSEEAESGVPHTPLSRAEMMEGARRRAEALVEKARREKLPWAYFIGLEGGLDVVDVPQESSLIRPAEETQRIEGLAAVGERQKIRGEAGAVRTTPPLVFLQNWAYVTDGARGAFGQSGSILIPDALAVTVVVEGFELAQAIDAFAGGKGIRDAQGAWGVLTRNMITRQDAFRVAVINAFAPFFNAALYR